MASYGYSSLDVMGAPKPRSLTIPYQVDFTKDNVGRHISSGKRHMKWRFGFANIEALQQNKGGHEARGAEHEVELVWSIASGRRKIVCNNVLVYEDKGKKSVKTSASGVFEHSFSLQKMHSDHLCQIKAQYFGSVLFGTSGDSTTGGSLGAGGDRQFDLRIDGQSFFDMVRLFQLNRPTIERIYRLNLQDIVVDKQTAPPPALMPPPEAPAPLPPQPPRTDANLIGSLDDDAGPLSTRNLPSTAPPPPTASVLNLAAPPPVSSPGGRNFRHAMMKRLSSLGSSEPSLAEADAPHAFRPNVSSSGLPALHEDQSVQPGGPNHSPHPHNSPSYPPPQGSPSAASLGPPRFVTTHQTSASDLADDITTVSFREDYRAVGPHSSGLPPAAPPPPFAVPPNLPPHAPPAYGGAPAYAAAPTHAPFPPPRPTSYYQQPHFDDAGSAVPSFAVPPPPAYRQH